MSDEEFGKLLESIREAKDILRGEKRAAREYSIEIPPTSALPPEGFVICVPTDDPDLLIPRKIYEAIFSHTGQVRIIDEAGESALYPEDFFLPVVFPKEVEQVLANLDSHYP
jgi:hypothetical protein